MTQLEDRLRTTFHDKAGHIPDQPPPLDLEPARPVRSIRTGRPHTRLHRRWIVPVAAAAAVLAVVAGAIVTSSVLSGTGSRPAGPAPSGVPRYYVALTGPSQYPAAVVRATRTGAVLARIDAPRPYAGFTELTGAANGRMFVLTAQEAAGSARPFPAYRFYLLRIDPTADSAADRARLTPLRLPIPHDTQTSAVALSPDGRSLAAITGYQIGAAVRLIVYNLVAHTSRSWKDPACRDFFCIGNGMNGSQNSGTLSWTANGHTLAVVVGGGIDPAVRLLDVSARGSNLLADSRLVPLHGAPALPGRPGETRLDGQWWVVRISPDGRSVFLGVEYPADRDSLMRFSARTGTLMSVVNNLPPRRSREELLWSSPHGSTLILTGIRPGATAGIVTGGRYTPVPWSPLFQYAAW